MKDNDITQKDDDERISDDESVINFYHDISDDTDGNINLRENIDCSTSRVVTPQKIGKHFNLFIY